MARFSDKKLSYSKQDALWNEFCAVLAEMHTLDEVRRFLKDLLNRQERLMLARRLLIADLLERGLTYREISERLRAGQTTIARVHRWLKFGREGYIRAITRLRKKRVK